MKASVISDVYLNPDIPKNTNSTDLWNKSYFCRPASKDGTMPNYSVNDIAKLARRHGYEKVEVNLRDENRMVSWRHDWKCGGVRINIYFTTGTVATCLDHPKRGKGQLLR